jgi:predicted nucleotidyltransferase
MTQSEEIAYHHGWEVGRTNKNTRKNNPYQDEGLKLAWDKGFMDGEFDYLDNKRWF